MRYSIIFWTFIGLSVMQTASAMDQGAQVQPPANQQPAAQPPVPAQQPQIIPPATRLRQHFNTIFAQFDVLTNEQLTHELDEATRALNELQQSINHYQADNNHNTANTAKVMRSFFDTIKHKITACRAQIGQLPAAGDDWLEQDVRHNQLNAIRQELAQIESQLNTLFRLLDGMTYRLAATQEGERDIALHVWDQQSKLSLAHVAGSTALSYGLNRFMSLGNPHSVANALSAAKQSADNLYTESLIRQQDNTSHLFDLAGRLGGSGFGRYNWLMPHLIAAARFLPDEPDGEPDPQKHQINRIMNLLNHFDETRHDIHEPTVPIDRPWLLRSVIRYAPTRLFRWIESAIRTAQNRENPQNWGAWLKSRATNYSSRLFCSFLRAAMGPSYYTFESGVQRNAPISDVIARVKQIYQYPLGQRLIDLGIDLAAYHAPEIRAGASTLNGWLENWKTCADTHNQQSLQARAVAARFQAQRNPNPINADMRRRLDEWANHWHQVQQAA